MTEQEALELGQKLYENLKSNTNNIIKVNDYIEYVEKSNVALEKQIEKRPKGLSWTHEQRVGNCPCCNKLVGELTDSCVCIKCGQVLDWENKNE